MAVLLIKLAAPLQSWGAASRFSVRKTELAPTKSGVIGMLAAAEGRRRTDPIEDLLSLRFGVRKDQPGSVIRDFQTARSLDGKDAMPLSQRYYLADAVFLAGIEGEVSLLQGLHEALQRPIFPLYLGRRSCPPTQPLSLGVREGELLDVLSQEPWIAATWFKDKWQREQQNKQRRGQQFLPFEAEILIDSDAVPDAERKGSYGSRDVPLSFNPEKRDYGFREVERQVTHLGTDRVVPDPHDPMAELEVND
ncbi:MAG: type I-E CRISPR-associated protein Cas5/CasD [Actinomycetaceae bacterium]|nr:type I-E CRISPR-associated protein Cas5/CasD [Actinomycetaceae bacterium]